MQNYHDSAPIGSGPLDDLPDGRVAAAVRLQLLTRRRCLFGVRSTSLKQAAVDLAGAGFVRIIADAGGVLHLERPARAGRR